MCLLHDVICVLSPYSHLSGYQAQVALMQESRASVTSQSVATTLEELVEIGLVRVFTEDNKRHGSRAQLRITCTPPLYRHYRLSSLGIAKQRYLLSLKRSEELRAERQRT